jgi:hypothetical protein
VGAQATIGGAASNGATRRNQLLAIAQAGKSQLTARAVVNGDERTYLLAGSVFDSDVTGETTTLAALDALAGKAATVTYTLVPNGTGLRALDRDGDGFRDGDERLACSNPADPLSRPDSTCRFDLAGDPFTLDGPDLSILLNNWGGSGAGDLNCDGVVGGQDLAILLNAWGPCGG